MRNRVRLHPAIPKENVKYVRKQSTDLGLDVILKDGTYNLSKQLSVTITEKTLDYGKVMIVGSKEHVALFISNYRGDWFRTSPIVSVERFGTDLRIKTQNSLYNLELVV